MIFRQFWAVWEKFIFLFFHPTEWCVVQPTWWMVWPTWWMVQPTWSGCSQHNAQCGPHNARCSWHDDTVGQTPPIWKKKLILTGNDFWDRIERLFAVWYREKLDWLKMMIPTSYFQNLDYYFSWYLKKMLLLFWLLLLTNMYSWSPFVNKS